MGFFKDAGDSILKYSEIIVNKTEVYTKIAKLNLDIKKLEGDIEKKEREAGQHCIKVLKEDGATITSGDKEIHSFISEIDGFRSTIAQKKQEIEQLKKAAGPEKENSSTQ